MDLKNMDMAQLKEKVLAVADKKTLIKFGIGFGSIVLFLIIWLHISPALCVEDSVSLVANTSKIFLAVL